MNIRVVVSEDVDHAVGDITVEKWFEYVLKSTEQGENVYVGTGVMLDRLRLAHKEGDPANWFVMFVMAEGVLGFIVTGLLVRAGIPIAIVAGTLLTLLYLPRFIIDLTKGLKMNHKSGDLEEINSLKKRLEQLEKGE